MFKGPFTQLTFMVLFFFIGFVSGVAPPFESHTQVYCPVGSVSPCNNPFFDCKNASIFDFRSCEQFKDCKGENCDEPFINAGDYAGEVPPPIIKNAPFIMLSIMLIGVLFNAVYYSVNLRLKNKKALKVIEEIQQKKEVKNERRVIK